MDFIVKEKKISKKEKMLVVESMMSNGNDFIYYLGKTLSYASKNDTHKIKDNFHELWVKNGGST